MAAAAVGGASSIQVAVRVRPFTIREAAQLAKCDDGPLFLGDGSLAATPAPKLGQKGIRNVIKVVDEKCLIFDPPEDNPVQRFSRSVVPQGKRSKDQTFGFDRVFDENITQSDVYDATTKPLLDSVLDGYNATVFAYGATGCGKTHTITGTAQAPGIIFLTMQELFERVDELRETKLGEVTLSYLEIYNETIRDLLNPGTGGKQGLMLREDANQAVSVAGLSSHKPHNVGEVMDMLIRGNSARTQSPTEANATSSRSHAVLQINVALKDRDADVHEPVTMATLSIIDLAGSERASVTKNRGDRLLEGANINKSLLALGSCINALCDPRKKNHVPYRNSKLTRLLKFSLGGNCRTVMIVCVSPSSQHFDETQNTLRYANRAKNIQTKSVRNVYNVDRHVKDYLKKIDEQMNRINELLAQQKQAEELAFIKFRKAESKRQEIVHDGVQRIRAAYDHSMEDRKERLAATLRLRQTERRIGAISGWIGAFDQVCDSREEEEPPLALVAMRKTAQGILIELEGSRQHHHQRLNKMVWTRALDTALQDGLRQLQTLDGHVAEGNEELILHKEFEVLRGNAEVEIQTAVLDQEKLGEAGLLQIMTTAHFETIAILNGILQMTEEEAIQAARGILGKLLQSSIEATGQVIKPDGGLQITQAVAPSRSGTPRKRKQVPVLGPSPIKNKIRNSIAGETVASAVPAHVALEVNPSPDQTVSPARAALASPRRRAKLGAPVRKGASFLGPGTPRRKSPTKKRAVRWKDEDTDDGKLVEFQATPKFNDESPTNTESYSASAIPLPTNMSPSGENRPNSSPSAAGSFNHGDARKAGTGRFATGFLTKRSDGSPTPAPMTSVALPPLIGSEPSPLSEMEPNRVPHTRAVTANLAMGASALIEHTAESSGSDVEKSILNDKESAKQIRSAIRQKRSSSMGSSSSASSRARDPHRRRSPTATSSSPPSDAHQGIFSASHARRMVRSERDDSLHDVLGPRTQPVVKGTGPVAVRRSMLDLESPAGSDSSRNSLPGHVVRSSHMRASSGVAGNVGRTTTSKAAWR